MAKLKHSLCSYFKAPIFSLEKNFICFSGNLYRKITINIIKLFLSLRWNNSVLKNYNSKWHTLYHDISHSTLNFDQKWTHWYLPVLVISTVSCFSNASTHIEFWFIRLWCGCAIAGEVVKCIEIVTDPFAGGEMSSNSMLFPIDSEHSLPFLDPSTLSSSSSWKNWQILKIKFSAFWVLQMKTFLPSGFRVAFYFSFLVEFD